MNAVECLQIGEEKNELLNLLAVVKKARKQQLFFFYQCLESVMQRTNKKNATYMGMAFLFLSVTITPLSLKSINLSPSLTAGLDAWRQISSVFGDNHQPVTSSELLALNSFNSDDATTVDSSNGIEQSLIAELQPATTESYDLQLSTVELQAKETGTRQKRCSKPAVQSLRAVRRSVINPEIEIHAQSMVSAVKPVMVINKADWKNFEKHLSQYKFDIGEAMKLLPMKDVKVMIKMKGLSAPVAPAAPRCNTRKAPLPEQVKELQQRAMRAREADKLPTDFENCEL